MVGLGDIPCVGKFVERVSEYTVDAVFRGLKYMFCYKALVNDLNSEIGKLNIEKDNLSRKIEEEEKNGKIIKDYVSKWQKDVEEIQESAEELSPSCSCIQRLPIPDPISRFRIGRNAVKKAMTVAELKESANEYLTGEIAYLPPVINLPKSDTTFEEFQSRKDAYSKLWDALVDEDGPLIHGIYGMAGVGKTRMMEQLWEDGMKKNIFNKVVHVNVGSENRGIENRDKIKLQEQIAGRLECKLESEVVESRASQLQNSLRNGGKILLILDDVWTEIPLNDIIGDPFGDGSSSSKGSKILLTSRQKEVCLNNECKHVVEIETLSPDEALYLFKKTVGLDTINSLPDKSLVEKVCNKCGKLPLLIHAVGKALKRKPHNSWKDAHDQLMKGKFEKIAGVKPHVYTGIKLSIDYLQNDDAKSCLFLCSMFPEDAIIDMEMLILLATGSQLIPDGESRVLAMVDDLKISSLLQERYHEIKVHDIIRDVARSIAFTDSNYAFLQVTCNSRYLPSNANYCTRRFLRLDLETDDVHFDERLICPNLHTLWLQSNNHPQQFSGGFFSMFANLSCLVLQEVKISLEQFSLQPLGNLETLALLQCNISKTDVSLFPKSLKTLCIWYCDLPSPLDVANLKYLRKLEILDREPVLVMVNVISSLSSLEELHIPSGFINDRNEYHVEPIVMEISKLTHLTSLQFHFRDDVTFQGTDIFSNIDRYNILVSQPEYSSITLSSTRSIELRVNHWKSWEGLMVRAENLILRDNDVELSSICNVHRTAFVDLKILHIEGCHNMGHIASISDDEIQYSLQPATCFSKLTILQIITCSKLKYLFCDNIAKSLGQLQELWVIDCDSLEAIIMNEGGTSDGEIIIFSQLKSLRISYMPSLASFYAEKKDMQCTNPSPQHQPFFDGMVAFPSLEELNISSLWRTSVIWGKDCCNDTRSSFCKLNHLRVFWLYNLEIVIPQAMSRRLNNLKYIEAYNCSSLRTMFPPAAASDLTHLQGMIVQECGGMREIIEAGEQVITDGILFPELTFLQLSGLQSLTSFWCYQSEKANSCKVSLRLPRLSSVDLENLPDIKSLFHGANFEFHMPALNEVEVDSCGLSTLFTISMFRNFQLQKLEVRDCDLLENIVEDLKGDETCDKIITLSQLTAVEFENLPNVKSFFHNANYEFHLPVIKKVKVLGCGLSSALFTRSVFKNLKQLEELSVCDCELLEGVFEDARGDETLDTSDKIITLNRVSKVVLQGLPRFKSIFYGATYECHMPALKNVKIVGCEISVLFTWSVFREIRRLEKLHVSNCKLLEHIVEEVEDDETSEINGKGITSSQLSSITLEYLPNLKSYSHTSSYVFNMPNLQTFRLIQCPRIEYFSSSKTNTSLVLVTSDWCSEEGFQDLNDFIRQNHKRGSYLNDCAGESSYSSQDLGTQSEIIEEEKPNETETDQHESSV